jgi:hypothetical protein
VQITAFFNLLLIKNVTAAAGTMTCAVKQDFSVCYQELIAHVYEVVLWLDKAVNPCLIFSRLGRLLCLTGFKILLKKKTQKMISLSLLK